MDIVHISITALFFGPIALVILWLLIRFGEEPRKPVWPGFVALGVWLLQIPILIFSMGHCISGHCNLSLAQEVASTILPIAINIGILAWVVADWLGMK